jgi:hypothetical protein
MYMSISTFQSHISHLAIEALGVLFKHRYIMLQHMNSYILFTQTQREIRNFNRQRAQREIRQFNRNQG